MQRPLTGALSIVNVNSSANWSYKWVPHQKWRSFPPPLFLIRYTIEVTLSPSAWNRVISLSQNCWINERFSQAQLWWLSFSLNLSSLWTAGVRTDTLHNHAPSDPSHRVMWVNVQHVEWKCCFLCWLFHVFSMKLKYSHKFHYLTLLNFITVCDSV